MTPRTAFYVIGTVVTLVLCPLPIEYVEWLYTAIGVLIGFMAFSAIAIGVLYTIVEAFGSMAFCGLSLALFAFLIIVIWTVVGRVFLVVMAHVLFLGLLDLGFTLLKNKFKKTATHSD